MLCAFNNETQMMPCVSDADVETIIGLLHRVTSTLYITLNLNAINQITIPGLYANDPPPPPSPCNPLALPSILYTTVSIYWHYDLWYNYSIQDWRVGEDWGGGGEKTGLGYNNLIISEVINYKVYIIHKIYYMCTVHYYTTSYMCYQLYLE